jgi:DNA polymerase III epsilon subunit-like protein
MKYFFFDTETTGLIKNSKAPADQQPRITELFAMLCDEEGVELSNYNQLFNPQEKLSAEITKITGLKDSDLRDKPLFKDQVSDIQTLLDDADAVVGHNLSFDLAMVENEYKRASTEVKWPKRKICTIEQTMHLKGHRLSLTKLYELLFSEPFKGAHRAEYDVRAMARCFFELKRRDLI